MYPYWYLRSKKFYGDIVNVHEEKFLKHSKRRLPSIDLKLKKKLVDSSFIHSMWTQFLKQVWLSVICWVVIISERNFFFHWKHFKVMKKFTNSHISKVSIWSVCASFFCCVESNFNFSCIVRISSRKKNESKSHIFSACAANHFDYSSEVVKKSN